MKKTHWLIAFVSIIALLGASAASVGATGFNGYDEIGNYPTGSSPNAQDAPNSAIKVPITFNDLEGGGGCWSGGVNDPCSPVQPDYVNALASGNTHTFLFIVDGEDRVTADSLSPNTSWRGGEQEMQYELNNGIATYGLQTSWAQEIYNLRESGNTVYIQVGNEPDTVKMNEGSNYNPATNPCPTLNNSSDESLCGGYWRNTLITFANQMFNGTQTNQYATLSINGNSCTSGWIVCLDDPIIVPALPTDWVDANNSVNDTPHAAQSMLQYLSTNCGGSGQPVCGGVLNAYSFTVLADDYTNSTGNFWQPTSPDNGTSNIAVQNFVSLTDPANLRQPIYTVVGEAGINLGGTAQTAGWNEQHICPLYTHYTYNGTEEILGIFRFYNASSELSTYPTNYFAHPGESFGC